MIIRRVTCPICGNDTRVNNTKYTQKCEFCRRPLNVTFEWSAKHGQKTKWKVSSVEPCDDSINKERNGQNERV